MVTATEYGASRRPWLCDHHYFCINTAVHRGFLNYETAMSWFGFISVQCPECLKRDG